MERQRGADAEEAESDVVAVRILDAEFSEPVRRVIDRVVDACATLLNLGVDGIDVVDALVADVGFKPATPIEDGIARFIAWYRSYYGS